MILTVDVAVAAGGSVDAAVGAINCPTLADVCAVQAVSPLASNHNASPVNPKGNRICARPKSGTGYTRHKIMSRSAPEISLLSWRIAMAGLAVVTSAVILAAVLIARQGQTISTALNFDRNAEGWTVRAGSLEADRLVLRPAAHSIGLALHPIESATFTLQTHIAFYPSQGAAGLIVQADDPDHLCAFLISGDGYFRISDYRNGVWIDRAAWRAWPHIRRDGSANVLRAECGSDSCTVFVNDEWTWQENGVPVTRWIGVIADGTEAHFDQLSWQP